MMATIWFEAPMAVDAERAWQALRHVDLAHELFSPVLVGGSMEGAVRTVTFANGLVIQEQIITIDETRRRIAYTVLGDRFDHHSASMQIVPTGEQSCQFLWISDFLPDDRAETISALMKQGSEALTKNIERQFLCEP
jgi:hypothetical protein